MKDHEISDLVNQVRDMPSCSSKFNRTINLLFVNLFLNVMIFLIVIGPDELIVSSLMVG